MLAYILGLLQNGAIRGLQIGPGFRDYKSGQGGLQMGAAEAFQIGARGITNRGRDFKSRQRDLGQRIQIEAIGIKGRDYNLVQNTHKQMSQHLFFVNSCLVFTHSNTQNKFLLNIMNSIILKYIYT